MNQMLALIAALLPILTGAFAPASLRSTKTTSSRDSPLPLQATRRLGIFGGGTVGGGIVEILQKKKDYLKDLTGSDIEIAALCVRDLSKKRDFDIPEGCTVTDKYSDILTDDSIDMVVEVMGGIDDAKDVVYDSLKAGKDVVTANKALIAKYLPEIENLLTTVNKGRDQMVEFRYEAAVCGGIPVIRSMQSDFVGDDISMISGIINGCTNFMLTSMDQGGLSYDAALAEASKLGYAEADPTLDVGGFDARSKLRILMRLGMGVEVDEDEISCRGITDLTKLDFEYAKMMGGTIKLIGVAKQVSKNKVAAFVSPCYVTGGDAVSAKTTDTRNYSTYNVVQIFSHLPVCFIN